MAGDKNWNRICAAGAANGANGLRFADLPRDFTVTACFATGDFLQHAPDVLLKRRAAGQIERRDIFRFTSGKNTFQRSGGYTMPAEDFCWNMSDVAAEVRARYRFGETRRFAGLWKIQSGQTFSRIARDELSVARGELIIRRNEFSPAVFV